MNIVEYPDREMMAMDLAQALAGELNDHLMSEGRASLAVPGGTTPGPIFDSLCAADLAWDKVQILLTDERWVPEDHPRSNTQLLKDRLLVNRAAAATYVPLYHPGSAEPEDGIPALLNGLNAALPLSILILGMGEDMHTASLFPYAMGLEAALAPDAPLLMPVRPADQPEARVTLTGPVLRAALSTHIVITGAAKRAALDAAAREGDPIKAPITTVLKGATIHWAE